MTLICYFPLSPLPPRSATFVFLKERSIQKRHREGCYNQTVLLLALTRSRAFGDLVVPYLPLIYNNVKTVCQVVAVLLYHARV